LRVVHITPYFAPAFRYGGPPRSILGLCKGLQAAGVEVDVITTASDGTVDLAASPPEGELYEGITVRYLPRMFPRRFFGACLGPALREAADRADLFHIHGLWNVPGWRAARVARARGIPYVLSPRGMLQPAAVRHRRFRKRLAYQLLERRSLACAARLHATAGEEAAVLAALVGPRRVVRIPNGVDVDATLQSGSGIRERLGIPIGDPVIVFLGRLHPIKRLDLLAASVARVRNERPDVHLVLAGPNDDGYLPSLQPLLAPLGRFVHWIGPIDDPDKWALLKEASALALCSDSESFGMAVIEAMAAGVPVVVARTCPWSDIVREDCGFWIDQRVEAIADAIATLVSDRPRGIAMGQRGARFARARFSWGAIGEAMAACYRDVLSEVNAEASTDVGPSFSSGARPQGRAYSPR
jgi:glycosyltransferase involved in cell wall biosynthesis